MKTFNYKMRFSPYSGTLKAKNYEDAWVKLQKLFPKYNVKKTTEYLTRA